MYPRVYKGSRMKGEATTKQIEYAEAIAELLGVGLPVERTKQTMSDFINRHVNRYKEVLEEMKLEHETEMLMVDGRRDW